MNIFLGIIFIIIAIFTFFADACDLENSSYGRYGGYLFCFIYRLIIIILSLLSCIYYLLFNKHVWIVILLFIACIINIIFLISKMRITKGYLIDRPIIVFILPVLFLTVGIASFFF